eukprot:scaffold151488_cov33-Tisochrysis_lutea.AAC.4
MDNVSPRGNARAVAARNVGKYLVVFKTDYRWKHPNVQFVRKERGIFRIYPDETAFHVARSQVGHVLNHDLAISERQNEDCTMGKNRQHDRSMSDSRCSRAITCLSHA